MPVDPGFWEGVSPRFLDYEEDNPARKFAAEEIIGSGATSVIEVGFGGAIDYCKFFACSGIGYIGVDACRSFVESARARFPSASFVVGGFESLLPRSADAVYTKATLEHQESAIGPLSSMLDAARSICVVNWYIPPGEERLLFDRAQRVWYNRHDRAAVLGEVDRSGFDLREVPFDNGNLVYVMTRRLACR